MRIVIIGGTGHIGTYLVPRLLLKGHEVIVVSRNQRQPYHAGPEWARVQMIEIDREREEQTGSFGPMIRALGADVVIDLICFTLESARALVEALRGGVRHFLHCGTIWIYGHSEVVPTTEDMPRKPFGEYGVQKAAIEAYLLDEARRNGFPATALHPGHIVGPGWAPLNPAGHFNVKVFEKLAKGEELILPDMGLATVHHVHADDVAQLFELAMTSWSQSVGESFHAVSPAAVTLRGYAEAVAGWFGREANLKYLPWDEWKKTVSEEDARATYDHVAHSPCASIEKARRLLGYAPRYSSLQGVREAVAWLIANGKVDAPALL